MGLANWLTVLRILLIPIVVLLLVYRRPAAALVTFAVAALTDLADGYVARRRGPSRLGAFRDPKADKFLLIAAFATLTYLRILPPWIMIVVVSRDAILMLGALLIHMVGGRIYPRPTIFGKLATFLQVLTVLFGLLSQSFGWAQPMPLATLTWLAAGFTVVSGFQYIVHGMRYLHATDVVEGQPRDEVLYR